MAGIYLHIPFCKKACTYCDFHFSTSMQTKDDFLQALLLEIKNRAHEINEPIKTIYFGGGTPSVLSAEEITKIIDSIYLYFNVVNNAEITLESNPDDLDWAYLNRLKTTKINRLSIGIQSFRAQDLEFMKRAHSVQQAEECVQNAQKIGFNNITIDLIYGIPQLSDAEWLENMQKAINLNVQHISAYALTVEENTPLFHLIHRKKVQNVDDTQSARQFLQLMEFLPANGFEQYEISNFAKNGFRSQHNSSYWQGVSYLGLGPSAHSFDGKNRRWNVSNNLKYIKAVENGAIYFETEALSTSERFNEYVMISLRRIEGMDFNFISSEFGNEYINHIEKELLNVENNLYKRVGELLFLTQEGRLLADGIASDLFYSTTTK